MTEDRRVPSTDDAPEQTYGQGEGRHEPAIPDDEESSDSMRSTYSEGTATDVDDPDVLTRDDEGMDR
jgi:hypothetical protein